MNSYQIVNYSSAYLEDLIKMVSLFRVTLDKFKRIDSKVDLDSARKEVIEYINNENKYRIYLSIVDNCAVGYIILRIDGVIWVEQIFVLEEYRRKGIAKALYSASENYAKSIGEDTLYNYVHPNNDAIIAFLKSNDYTVLNLIEVRKKYKGEETKTTIKIANNEFDY